MVEIPLSTTTPLTAKGQPRVEINGLLIGGLLFCAAFWFGVYFGWKPVFRFLDSIVFGGVS